MIDRSVAEIGDRARVVEATPRARQAQALAQLLQPGDAILQFRNISGRLGWRRRPLRASHRPIRAAWMRRAPAGSHRIGRRSSVRRHRFGLIGE